MGKVLGDSLSTDIFCHRIIADIADVREDPAVESALATQIVRGTPVRVLETRGLFAYIYIPDQHYKGHVALNDLEARTMPETTIKTWALNGLGDYGTLPPTTDALLRVAHLTAAAYAHVPYKWGGTTPEGFDCSGFTRWVHGYLGVHLPRDAIQQWARTSNQYSAVKEGPPQEKLRTLEHCVPGSTLFFALHPNRHEQRINHVGILADDDLVLHCSSSLGSIGYTKIGSGLLGTRLEKRCIGGRDFLAEYSTYRK
jgi:cell wall-associated NlpC family hydrolase